METLQQCAVCMSGCVCGSARLAQSVLDDPISPLVTYHQRFVCPFFVFSQVGEQPIVTSIALDEVNTERSSAENCQHLKSASRPACVRFTGSFGHGL